MLTKSEKGICVFISAKKEEEEIRDRLNGDRKLIPHIPHK